MPEQIPAEVRAEAAHEELQYALAHEKCTPDQVRKSAKKLGIAPGLWFRLAIIMGALFAKLQALASGKPIVQTLHAFGQEAWVAAGLGAPPVIPGA